MTSFATFAGLNTNGWSMVAVNVMADVVAKELCARPDFSSYQENVPIHTMTRREGGPPLDFEGNHLTTTVYPNQRCVVLMQPVNCEWTLILRSIDFVYGDDITWVDEAAKRLSKNLGIIALACSGNDGCDCSVFDNGKTIKRVSGWDVAKVAAVFDSYAIDIPLCTTAGDPAEVWAAESTRQEITCVSLLTLSVTPQKTPPTPRRGKLPLHPMIASTCLDIVKISRFVPCDVKDEMNSYQSTIVDVVFDPLRIDEVNSEFKAAGYEFDDELMKVIAVNDDGSLLLWGGLNAVYHLRKSERMDNPLENNLAFNDILDLTFPFNIKKRRWKLTNCFLSCRRLMVKKTTPPNQRMQPSRK